jgi:hypothetical protein
VELRDDFTWSRLLGFLPSDLDLLSRRTGLVRRLRGTDSAQSLLRLLLACALPKASLAQVSVWGRETGLCRMSAPALFLRLREAEAFLLACLDETLRHARALPVRAFGGYRLLALDGTYLNGPGTKGTDRHLHVAYDLGSGCLRWVDATGPDEGEGLARHASRLGPEDLVLADRGYGREKGLLAALGAGARLLVRFEFSHLKLFDAKTGERLTPEKAEALIPPRAPADLWVKLPGWEHPLRALGIPGGADGPLWLLTNLEPQEISPEEARSLYGLRWQVELFFKRVKSLLDMDELPSRDGPTTRPWILAKLVLATLCVLLGEERFSPWGDAAGKVPLETVPQRTLEAPARNSRRARTHGQAQEKDAPKKKRTPPTMPLESLT